jgi:hypothetical protein
VKKIAAASPVPVEELASAGAGHMSRRELLGGTAWGLAGAATASAPLALAADGADGIAPDIDPKLASEIRSSSIFELTGEELDKNRLEAARPLLETNLKEIQLLREFDPDEEEPVTRFRPW